MTKRELIALMRDGHPLPKEALDGDFFGVSLGLPPFIERMTWKVFRKQFRVEGARVLGKNVRMEQYGPRGPAEPLLSKGAPIEFGPFEVTALPSGGSPFECREGWVLDYGAAHPAWHPMATVRDAVVAVNAGSTDLLLGALYLELAGQRTRTRSFFTLERETTRVLP
jgi:hypothetical protein